MVADARQHNSDCRRFGHPGEVLAGCEVEMVRRRRPVVGCKACSSRAAGLIGMDADAHSDIECLVGDALGLCRREPDRVDADIAVLC